MRRTTNKLRSSDFYIPGAEFLMPLEVPLLKVSRPVAACQRCRAAKIKCDGILPACTACVKSGRAAQCSSGNSQFAPGKERSYVSTLEARVEKLQSRIAELQKRRQSSITMSDFASPISTTKSTPNWDSPGRPKDRKARFRRELGTVDELVSDFGFLTVNANARDFQFGFTNAISYARLVLSAASKEPLPSGMVKQLPSKSAALPSVNLYVENILTLSPILDEGDIYRSLEATAGSEQSNATSMDHWTIRMVLAISSAAQSKHRGDTFYTDAIGHVCAALNVADQVLHPGSIWSIQAMLLLVQYSMLDPSHFDSWTLIGAASRATIDLGLHQDPSKSAKVGRAKIELRRRVYSCVYCLDRSTSIVQTRAFSFSDDAATVGLPFAQKPTSPTPIKSEITTQENMWTRSSDLAVAFIKWRQIQSSWYTQLFQSGRQPWADPYEKIWSFYNEMSDWFKALPQTTSPQIKEFIEIDVLYSYVYILSPSPRCPQPNEHAQRLIVENATTYAGLIKRLQSEPSGKLSPFTFYDAMRVYMVARHFVDTLTSNLEILMQPPRSPSMFSGSRHDSNTSMDPLAVPSSSSFAPPLKTPEPTDPPNTLSQAISTIETFAAVLTAFGNRFGYVSELSWRDKFQQEAQPLMNALQTRLQQQQQQNVHDSYFWTTQPGPVTPQGTLTASPPAHRLSASFYPSPAATQYSPNTLPQELDHKAPETTWAGTSNELSAAAPMYDYHNTAFVNEFGIANTAAWETLPGGSMNPRFS